MLVLLSNCYMSQNTSIQNTKCCTPEQMTEIYKGLKQGEYLKVRLKKTEDVLNEATGIINQQKQSISKQQEIITNKNLVIDNLNFQITKELEIAQAQKEQLNNTIKMNNIIAKSESKRKFWNGVKIGGVTVGIAGVATILLLNK